MGILSRAALDVIQELLYVLYEERRGQIAGYDYTDPQTFEMIYADKQIDTLNAETRQLFKDIEGRVGVPFDSSFIRS